MEFCYCHASGETDGCSAESGLWRRLRDAYSFLHLAPRGAITAVEHLEPFRVKRFEFFILRIQRK